MIYADYHLLWFANNLIFTDLLRILQLLQNYRYAKKTQISLDPKKYRYVGATVFDSVIQ